MPKTDPDRDEFALEQERQAAAEAGAIGGRVSDYPSSEDLDKDAGPAERPLVEAGEGEAEGFDLAERDLEEHATHGDQHGARRVLKDAQGFDEDSRATDGGEADQERTEPE